MTQRTLVCFASLLIAILSPLVTVAQNIVNNSDRKLMTAGEYETLIGRISQDLTTWEAKIKGIDPGKGNPSYDVGTQIDMYKTLGLLEISNAKKMIQQLKVKRTVYAELSLGDSLGEIAFCFFGLESSGVSDLGNQIKKTQDAIELSSVEILLKNDGMERLRLLENSSCAAGFMP